MASVARSILCPIDFSPLSDAALARATELARLTGANLTLLHVVNANLGDEESRAAHHAFEHRTSDVRASGIEKLEALIERGDPASEILSFLDTRRYDLVVMGSKGKSGLLGALLGGVTYKVARQAKTSVLLVRVDEAPAAS